MTSSTLFLFHLFLCYHKSTIHREQKYVALKVYYLLAEFGLAGVEGSHQCFILKPLTIDLFATRALDLMKSHSRLRASSLEFLHNKAQMVHCGGYMLFMELSKL
jgi:hypothetical protein